MATAGDPTRNIARRYRHLFTLPSAGAGVLFSSLPLLFLTTLARYVENTNLFLLALAYLPLAELLFLASTKMETVVLKTLGSKIASSRRLVAIGVIGNTIWFVLAVIGFFIFLLGGGEQRFFSLLVLGALFIAGFRLLVFGSVFFRRMISALPLALIQPLLLLLPLFLFGYTGLGIPFLLAIFLGIAAIAGVLTYLVLINRSYGKGFAPLKLLRAFLDAWVVEDPTELETMLDMVSKENQVRSELLVLSNKDLKKGAAEIVVPGIHPGPFHPIGSSNLPGDIYRILRSDPSAPLPLTVHSISDHDLNLSSKTQVAKYVSSLQRGGALLDRGNTMTIPICKSKKKATVTGIALGATALLSITQSPHGMEDFPLEVNDSVLSYSKENGFREVLVIDSHNSVGPKPDASETSDVIQVAKEVLEALKSAPQQEFRFAFSHSSEAQPPLPLRDIGPAGVGLLLFETPASRRYALVIVDANNAAVGFREQFIQAFEKSADCQLLELCTSDTHITAARIRNEKGYLALGELTSAEAFTQTLVAMFQLAKSRLSEGNYQSFAVESQVKTTGGNILEQFSGLLDATINTAKRGAIALTILVIASIVAIAAL